MSQINKKKIFKEKLYKFIITKQCDCCIVVSIILIKYIDSSSDLFLSLFSDFTYPAILDNLQ